MLVDRSLLDDRVWLLELQTQGDAVWEVDVRDESQFHLGANVELNLALHKHGVQTHQPHHGQAGTAAQEHSSKINLLESSFWGIPKNSK